MIKERRSDGTIQQIHGLSRHPLYNVFKSMHDRCENPKNAAYARYGGRGIHVCDDWALDNVGEFVSWAESHGWKQGLQMDRIDNNKGYSPENVRFVTAQQNSKNRRSNKYVTVRGETLLLADAIQKYSVVTKKQFELRYYHQRWPLEKALFQPLQIRRKNIERKEQP